MEKIEFSAIEGLQVGHAQDLEAATGCTVVISAEGATVGVDVRGGAPGTRETDLLNPVNLVQKAHAILLAGGSAFGLDAAAGVMQFLEERHIGLDVQVCKVPIVCGAVLFDLAIGNPQVRPDKTMGYQACLNAGFKQSNHGSIGAGTGATVGKIRGMDRAMKGGLGSYGLQTGNLQVAALVAVNCLGDVFDPLTGGKVAGLLSDDLRTLADTEEAMVNSCFKPDRLFGANTTIGVVATNAALTKSQATKVASMAQDGYARTIRPAHSMYDGDTIFAMATGAIEADLNVVGMLAARVMERAVVAAVEKAERLCNCKCCADLT